MSAKARTKAKKIIVGIVALVAIFLVLPFNAIGASLRAVTAPWYTDGLYSFAPPAQERTSFTSKSFDVKNPIFAEGNVTDFSNNAASGWEAHTPTSGRVAMGVVNTNAFDTFKGQQDIASLPFMTQNPHSSNSGSPNVLALANKSTTGSASASFSQTLGEFWADGYFEVKVDFFAVGSQSAVYLIPENGFVDGRPFPRVDVRQVSMTSNETLCAPCVPRCPPLPAPVPCPICGLEPCECDPPPPAPTITGCEFCDLTHVCNDTCEFERVTTPVANRSTWRTATFLVKTDRLESVTFTLGLYLGDYNGSAARGVVYYDNIRVTGYSATQFASVFEKAQQDALDRAPGYHFTSVVDLSNPVYPNQPDITDFSLTENIFEDFDSETIKFRQVETYETPDNTNILPFARITNLPAILNLEDSSKTIHGITKPDNRGVMALTTVNNSVSLQYHKPIKIERNEVYMINFYALASDGAFFRMRDTRHGRLDVPAHVRPTLYNSGFLPVLQNTTSSAPSNNNWILNTVFVVGESLADIETFFEFWIGGDGNTTGFLFVDNFSISRVSAEYYERHQENSNATECDLDWLTSTPTVGNANFNMGKKRSNLSAYPLIASDWNVLVEGEEVANHFNERRIINGIVNTDRAHWNRNGTIQIPERIQTAYGYATEHYVPAITGQGLNNNVYMMQNMEATYQTVSSSAFTLTSDTYNVISFDASTYDVSTREIWVILEIGEFEVTRLQLIPSYDVHTQSGITHGWENYKIGVQTSAFTSPEARITFALGTAAARTTGSVFIDNVRVTQGEVGTTLSDVSVNLSDTSKLFKRGTGADAEKGGESLFFAAEDSSTASAYFDAQAVKGGVLSISTKGAAYARVSNTTMTDALVEEKSYEYKVRLSTEAAVKMACTGPDGTEHALCRKDADGVSIHKKDTTQYGITLGIKGMDGGFIDLTNKEFASGNEESFLRPNNEIELRFLIKSGTPLDLSLEVIFGNENNPVEGSIGILGLELTEITDERFYAATEDKYTRIITTSTVPREDEDNGEREKLDLNWLILPSIITGVAIIFAIVGFSIRKIKFKSHITKHHTSYARDDFETKIPKKELKTPKAKKAKPMKKNLDDDSKDRPEAKKSARKLNAQGEGEKE